jgi:hypothetical protein
VLKLNRIRFSADEAVAARKLKQFRDSYPDRLVGHERQLKQHELQLDHHRREMDHYEKLLELHQSDFKEYAALAKEGGLEFPDLPRVPSKPSRPEPPGIRDQLAEINAEFAAQRFHYFDATSRFNWMACAGAIALVGRLLYLRMFDVNGSRIFHVIILAVRFVFMFGTFFHTILSSIVGFMKMLG